ncbi:MAG: hypothetical protein OXK80_01515 [Bdellovibrionales bacterium]|nr:hypothetical protein [Bdellovibrionales bacterium]
MIQPTLSFVNSYKKYLIVFSVLALFSLFFAWIHTTSNEEQEIVFQVSDNIPLGFVMVPIELENHSAVSDLISSHGVVDLYDKSMSIPHKLAEAVRAVRLQTGRFSVLIPEDQVSLFLKSSLLFHAVVQNPNAKGSRILSRRKKRSINVEAGF